MPLKHLLALISFSFLLHAQSGLDTTKWVAVDGGWIDQPNKDQICNLPSAVSVASGVLTLTARHQSVMCKGGVDYGPAKREWTGGTIYTKSFNFLYGSIEARIKSAGYGVHSGLLWMMGSGCQPITTGIRQAVATRSQSPAAARSVRRRAAAQWGQAHSAPRVAAGALLQRRQCGQP